MKSAAAEKRRGARKSVPFKPLHLETISALQALTIVVMHGESLCRDEYGLFCFRARCVCDPDGEQYQFCVRCDEIGDGKCIAKGALRTKLATCHKKLYNLLDSLSMT